jgi:perosamine synthetase
MAGAIRYPVAQPVLAGRETEYVLDAVSSGWISNGPYVGRFERLFAEGLGVEQCLSTCNGTAALHIACMAMGLKPGMDVIVPSLTYIASVNAIAYCGANPVFADSDRRTWNVTRESIEAVWTPRTVGVIAVHLYGMPAPVHEIADLCRERNVWLIEDCAESLGATLKGRPTGTFGDAAMWSFYGNKTISTGEGGMVYLRDPERREHARLLRGQGMDPNRRYWHPMIGYNYRMTNVAAAIGVGQMEMLDYHVGERRRVAKVYRRRLASLVDEGMLLLPVEPNDCQGSYWLFSAVLCSSGCGHRARIQRMLEDEYGIETRPFFVPAHRLPMYEAMPPRASTLPGAAFLGEHGINFPSYSGLADGDIEGICDAIALTLHATSV